MLWKARLVVEAWGFCPKDVEDDEEAKEGVVGAETEARTDMHWSMRPTISVTCLESSTFWSAVLPPVGSRRLPWMELLPMLVMLGATCGGNCCTGVDMLRLRFAMPAPLGVDMAA